MMIRRRRDENHHFTLSVFLKIDEYLQEFEWCMKEVRENFLVRKAREKMENSSERSASMEWDGSVSDEGYLYQEKVRMEGGGRVDGFKGVGRRGGGVMGGDVWCVVVTVGYYLEKPDLKKLPLWVNLYGVPLEVWNVQGLSELASGIGVPLALDRATEERCIKQAGRAGFARVLIEVAADKSISNEIVCLVPLLDGKSEKEIIVRAEYSWKPPRCSHCCLFGHSFANCVVRPLSDEEKVLKDKKDDRSDGKMDDGFQLVGRRNRVVGNNSKGVGGMGQQTGAKFGTNQRSGAKKEDGKEGKSQGAVQGTSGQILNSGNSGVRGVQGQTTNGGSLGAQNRGERVWQVKKNVSQQQRGSDRASGSVFEKGQSSGVKKEGVAVNYNGRRFGNRKQGQQVEGRGSAPLREVLEDVGVNKNRVGKPLGQRVEVRGNESLVDKNLEVRVVNNAIPTNNVFDVLSNVDELNGVDMNVDKGSEQAEEWFEEGVGVGKDGNLNDLVWQFQKVAVDYYLEQGINPAPDIIQSWNERQINYFNAVHNGEMVFEKEDAPEFMKPPSKWVSNNSVCDGRTRIIIGWDPNKIILDVAAVFSQVVHAHIFHIESKRWFHCSFIYAANEVGIRRELWAQLVLHKEVVKLDPWVILGDFNVGLHPSDSSRGSSMVSVGMQEFRDCVNAIEMEDLSATGLNFTWIQKPLSDGGGKGLLKKLDRVMGNLAFFEDFRIASVVFLPWGLSDHSMVILSIPGLSPFKQRPFKFLNFWTENPKFLPLVMGAWELYFDGCYMFSLVSKLKFLKKGLRKLHREHGDVFERVRCIRREVEIVQRDIDCDPECGELRYEGAVLLKCLKDALFDEESVLRQRSKIQWLKEGDSNSKYFHSVVKSHGNKGWINEVEDMDGNRFMGAAVPQQFVLHFKKMLGTSENVEPISDPDDLFVRKLSVQQADWMVRPVEDLEIKEAIFSIDDLKAPGPDGFSSRFFKKAWPIVGNEVCSAVKEFFYNGKLLGEVNATVLTLVPKSQCPRNVADFRPIACCNVIYKCISKVLVGRIKEGLARLVDLNQSAFIPNRNIGDNVLLAQELMRGYHRQRGSRRCAFKIDIQKAYDTVNWCFLEEILKRFGFHPCMISWLMKCITSASFTLRVNGEHHDFFPAKRGVRQGDPLSPYLFTLVMEVLTLMVRRRVHNCPQFRFHPRCEKLGLTHLCFADDLLMFCYGNVESVRVLKDALLEFSASSGLKPSMIKSTSFLVKRRIMDWKNRWLSFAGRLQLINSVLSSISVYWSSMFLLPVSVVKEVEKLLRNFLWSSGEAIRGKAKVAWKVVCLPRSKGGLGVRSLKLWNKILLSKQIWKILDCGDSLWVKWLHTYRLKGRCFWDVGEVFDAPWFWRKIIRIRDDFRCNLVSIIGDGRSTFLWFDNWHPLGPLCQFISKRDLYEAKVDVKMKVRDVICDGLWLWPVDLWNKFRDILQLYQPALKENVGDKVFWRSHSGSVDDFSVATVWEENFLNFEDKRWHKLIWFSQGVPRHAFILWLAINERLRTLDRLMNWKVKEEAVCVLCGIGVESHSHIFVECVYSLEVWNCLEGVSGIYNLISSMEGGGNSWSTLIEKLSEVKVGNSIWSIIHRLVLAAGVYFIWQERNKRLHGDSSRSAVILARQIFQLLQMKLMGLKVKDSSHVRRAAMIWDLEFRNGGLCAKF
ncbi:hypothetical protein OSB04_un001013 [Centaurea solstitialis]|uniref:Reverse transcriptase domain-containing protein n=1 Tax=Centaurea solstitialis TaxID=347529 RepID=A0AA38VUZ7_9ASTR|nr:hypothetical protein OSB04_un001013 [Centaurea solstitialis]